MPKSRLEHIPLDNPNQRFTHHLTPENNQRIFFSGNFGTGKTYFLEHYFREYSEKYNVIHLFPVNYQITSNEDILELIKYDILSHLLINYGDKGLFENEKLSESLKVSLFLQNSANEVLSPFLEGLGKLSDSFEGLMKFTESLEKLGKINRKAYEKYKLELESKIPVVSEYLKTQLLKKGSIFESDYYSELIRGLIKEVKENNPSKENVLILDDLDRIDPDHIFRILNIFSAHLDSSEDKNKFSFDKVIIVADYDNVKSCFKHRYGEKVDFEGYIDKFFSVDVFFYSNLEVLLQRLVKILQTIATKNVKGFDFNDSHAAISADCVYFVKLLLNNKALRIRALNRVCNQFYSFPSHPNLEYNYVFFYIANFLIHLCGSVDALLSSLKKCQEETNFHLDEADKENKYKTLNVLPVLTVEDPNKVGGDIKIKDYQIKYTLRREGYKLVAKIDEVNDPKVPNEVYLDLFIKALEKIRALNLI